QVVTSYVNEEGKEINPSDKGTKDKKDIPEYIYIETKKDEKGNIVHVYRQNIKPTNPIKPVKSTELKTPQVEEIVQKVSTKRLANTGTTETNTGLAGLGLALFGGLLAATKRRRNK
ncbi:LPXTG cell wall anchor domain-containing protein, partial [uncultured Gemella sp.]|uniref:LPXTG cell wall anchor domain-containing protein n=1 Tax=uncultured Gemella sp. TaxID=254352 RepID=UPI0028D71978